MFKPRALQLKMKALYSQTPSDYLRNTRLEFAKKQLIDSASNWTSREQAGFSSQVLPEALRAMLAYHQNSIEKKIKNMPNFASVNKVFA